MQGIEPDFKHFATMQFYSIKVAGGPCFDYLMLTLKLFLHMQRGPFLREQFTVGVLTATQDQSCQPFTSLRPPFLNSCYVSLSFLASWRFTYCYSPFCLFASLLRIYWSIGAFLSFPLSCCNCIESFAVKTTICTRIWSGSRHILSFVCRSCFSHLTAWQWGGHGIFLSSLRI